MWVGPTRWDPVLIVAQIIVLQCLFYISLGCLLWLLLGPYVAHLSLHHFFDWQWVSFRNFTGWMVIIANIFNALAAAVYLVVVVERAKKCLDFAATLYLLHLVFTFSYSGFSRSVAWWLTNFVGLVVVAVLGEWLCLQREMRDIPVGTGSRRKSGSTELVSLRTPSLPSPSVTPTAVTASSFQHFMKLPGGAKPASRSGPLGLPISAV